MLSIDFIRNNLDIIKKGIVLKGYEASLVDELLELDARRRQLIVEIDQLRAERNAAAEKKDIEKGRGIKEQLRLKEPRLKEIEDDFKEALQKIPNLPASDAPSGKGEQDNVEIQKVGEVPKFSFKPKDHVELGKLLDIIDFERGAKVAGSGFYYLKNEGALLEVALVSYGLKFLSEKGFTPIITPDLSKDKFYLGTGYLPKGSEAQTFRVEESDLGLIATAEVTLAGYHSDEILDAKDLPKKYGGYSHCFRKEAGAYGKYSKGLYRVHQFTKVEMFAYTTEENSPSVHQEFLKLEEEFWHNLGIPFRAVEMCTGDLGSQAAKKYDLEAWMPGRGEYGEITSTSNTTDYQARNLNIKYREGDKTKFAHTLNGTLVATSRGIIAILENYQQEDGSVKIPEALQKYTGFFEIKLKTKE